MQEMKDCERCYTPYVGTRLSRFCRFCRYSHNKGLPLLGKRRKCRCGRMYRATLRAKGCPICRYETKIKKAKKWHKQAKKRKKK